MTFASTVSKRRIQVRTGKRTPTLPDRGLSNKRRTVHQTPPSPPPASTIPTSGRPYPWLSVTGPFRSGARIAFIGRTAHRPGASQSWSTRLLLGSGRCGVDLLVLGDTLLLIEGIPGTCCLRNEVRDVLPACVHDECKQEGEDGIQEVEVGGGRQWILLTT